jgi:hypothetical protein
VEQIHGERRQLKSRRALEKKASWSQWQSVFPQNTRKGCIRDGEPSAGSPEERSPFLSTGYLPRDRFPPDGPAGDSADSRWSLGEQCAENTLP